MSLPDWCAQHSFKEFLELMEDNKEEKQMEQNYEAYNLDGLSPEMAAKMQDQTDKFNALMEAPSIVPTEGTDQLDIQQGDIVEYFQDTEALAEA